MAFAYKTTYLTLSKRRATKLNISPLVMHYKCDDSMYLVVNFPLARFHSHSNMWLKKVYQKDPTYLCRKPYRSNNRYPVLLSYSFKSNFKTSYIHKKLVIIEM